MAAQGSSVGLPQTVVVACLLASFIGLNHASQLDPRSVSQDERHRQHHNQQQPPPATLSYDNLNNNNNNTVTTIPHIPGDSSREEPPPPPQQPPPTHRQHHNNNHNNQHHHHNNNNPPSRSGQVGGDSRSSISSSGGSVGGVGGVGGGGGGGGGVGHTPAPPMIGPSDPRDDQSRRHRRRNRRCKCVKRFMKEVDQLIDERLEHFEHKYLRQANLEKERALALQNEASSTASRIQGLDKALLVLNSDVLQTKETLAVMSSSLEVLRHEMDLTRGEVGFLNESFKVLDGAVDNLSRFVKRVERMIPSGLTRVDGDGSRLLGLGGLGGVGGVGGGADGRGGSDLDADPLQSYPRNCDEVYRQGGMQFQGDYYIMIKPDEVARPFKVLCKIFNNSGWTVIQKRQDGSVDFFRTWQEYRKGFGSLEGEFWLGNDYIHHLSVQEPTKLRIELTDWEDRTYYAEYDSFRIDNEKGLYRLHIGNYHGDAGDSLRSHWENHDGMPFSTKDRDNDGRYYDSCAEHFHGAWWFNNCFDSHLNGKYYHKGFHKNYFQRDGIQWNTIHMYSSLKSVCMMIKPAVSVPVAARSPSGSGSGSSSSSSSGSSGSSGSGSGKRSGKRNKRGRGSRGKGRRASRKDRKKDN